MGSKLCCWVKKGHETWVEYETSNQSAPLKCQNDIFDFYLSLFVFGSLDASEMTGIFKLLNLFRIFNQIMQTVGSRAPLVTSLNHQNCDADPV